MNLRIKLVGVTVGMILASTVEAAPRWSRASLRQARRCGRQRRPSTDGRRAPARRPVPRLFTRSLALRLLRP